jgi:hypothetical protein
MIPPASGATSRVSSRGPSASQAATPAIPKPKVHDVVVAEMRQEHGVVAHPVCVEPDEAAGEVRHRPGGDPDRHQVGEPHRPVQAHEERTQHHDRDDVGRRLSGPSRRPEHPEAGRGGTGDTHEDRTTHPALHHYILTAGGEAEAAPR